MTRTIRTCGARVRVAQDACAGRDVRARVERARCAQAEACEICGVELRVADVDVVAGREQAPGERLGRRGVARKVRTVLGVVADGIRPAGAFVGDDGAHRDGADPWRASSDESGERDGYDHDASVRCMRTSAPWCRRETRFAETPSRREISNCVRPKR